MTYPLLIRSEQQFLEGLLPQLLERLAAPVPSPRMHQLTCHGVLAPGSSRRSEIVPRRVRQRAGPCREAKTATRPCDCYSWSELMQRAFAVDVLKCAKHGSRRRWIAAITEMAVTVKILEHLCLPSVAPTPEPARPPPQLELSFEGCRGESDGTLVPMVGEVCPVRDVNAAIGVCASADGASKGPWAAIKP